MELVTRAVELRAAQPVSRRGRQKVANSGDVGSCFAQVLPFKRRVIVTSNPAEDRPGELSPLNWRETWYALHTQRRSESEFTASFVLDGGWQYVQKF